MGKGKGGVEGWVAPVSPGRIFLNVMVLIWKLHKNH